MLEFKFCRCANGTHRQTPVGSLMDLLKLRADATNGTSYGSTFGIGNGARLKVGKAGGGAKDETAVRQGLKIRNAGLQALNA